MVRALHEKQHFEYGESLWDHVLLETENLAREEMPERRNRIEDKW